MKSALTQIVLLSFFFLDAISQVNPAVLRRDWFVGTYDGLIKDSTINSSWKPCNFKIYRHNEFGGPLQDDTTVTFTTGGFSSVVCIDSTIGNNRFCSTPSPNYVQYAKLYYDSLFVLNFWSIGGTGCHSSPGFASPGNWIMFRGKKTSNFTGIENLLLNPNSFIIYPNPASDKLHITNALLYEVVKYSLYTIEGREVLADYLKDEIDVSMLTEGLYFLKIKTPEGILTKKIVIQH